MAMLNNQMVITMAVLHRTTFRIRGTSWMVPFFGALEICHFWSSKLGTPAKKARDAVHQNLMGLWGSLKFRPKSAQIWAFHFATQMLMSDQTP